MANLLFAVGKFIFLNLAHGARGVFFIQLYFENRPGTKIPNLVLISLPEWPLIGSVYIFFAVSKLTVSTRSLKVDSRLSKLDSFKSSDAWVSSFAFHVSRDQQFWIFTTHKDFEETIILFLKEK